MSWFDVYIIMKLDTFVIFAMICAIIIFCAIGILALIIFESGEDFSEYKRSFLSLTIALIISTTVTIFLPTTSQAAAMYVLPKIANSEVIKKDVPEIYDLGIKYLKDKLNGESK